jgi:hypothetical protein
MYTIDKIIDILLYRKQIKLAKLLDGAEYDFTESATYGSRWNSTLTTVNIYSPIKFYEKLIKLNESEKKEIINAFHIPYPIKDNEIEIDHIEFFVHPDKPILDDEKIIIQKDGIETDYWHEGFYRLFISHSSKIKIKANELSEALLEYAMSGFVAHDDIEPTMEWQSVIENALITCDGLIVLLSDEFPKSFWTDQEVGICYALKKIIIPVRLGIDPYGFIGKYQGLKGSNKEMNDIAFDVFKLLIKNKKASEQLSRSIIAKFINSSSYDDAKNNMKLLKFVTYMDKQLLKDLIKSEKENSQIRDSFVVPNKLDNFIKDWKDKI